MAQRKVKKETPEEYESRKAYMKQKAREIQLIKERKDAEYLKREEIRQKKKESKREKQRVKQMKEAFGPLIQKPTQFQIDMQKHEEKLKRETKSYEREKAYQEREARRKLLGPSYRSFDIPEPKFRMSWNVEGN